MHRNCQDLPFATWQFSAQLGVTSLLCHNIETEVVQHMEDLAGR